MEPQKKDNDNQKSATNKYLERLSWVQKVRVDEHLYIRWNLQWEETFLNIVMFVHQISGSSACWWTRTRNRKQLAERITTLKTLRSKRKWQNLGHDLSFPKACKVFMHGNVKQTPTQAYVLTSDFSGAKLSALPDGLIEQLLWVLNLRKDDLVRASLLHCSPSSQKSSRRWGQSNHVIHKHIDLFI